jgi:hypothetical protein
MSKYDSRRSYLSRLAPSEARRLADAILARRRGHDRSGIAAVYSPLPDDHDEMVSRQTTDKEWNEQ